MFVLVHNISGFGWRTRCADYTGVTLQTVKNVENGKSTHKGVIKWVMEEYEECLLIDRLINDK